jgi:hypothetical protein
LSDGTVGVAGVVATFEVVATSVDPTVTAADSDADAGVTSAVVTSARAAAIAISGFFNEVIVLFSLFLY